MSVKDCWDIGAIRYIPFTHCFDKKILIRDHENTCVKDKELNRKRYYNIYNSSYLTWNEFLDA
jgi:hypothetical protein